MRPIEDLPRASEMPHASPALAEADRLMTICNSCRYCEGLCAVFPAMEMRRSFADADLRYLANLCHSCGACYDDCQFSPPHEFSINVPQVLAEVREASYGEYAWPKSASAFFDRNTIIVSTVTVVAIGLFIAVLMALNGGAVLFESQPAAGSFYRLLSHDAMALIFGVASLFALAAMVMAFRQFWHETAAISQNGTDGMSVWQAVKDAASLRYLDGNRAGCANDEDPPRDLRRLFHHLTFYGFALCFASTSVATLYHYLLGREAPYAWYDLPVILGTLGGIGLVVGTAGLLRSKAKRAKPLRSPDRGGLGSAFTLMLLLTGASGLLLLVARDTQVLGALLALHLGAVLSLFVTMPYGKFVHGLYRFGALVRYAQERRALLQGVQK